MTLRGKHIVVTRAAHQYDDLAALLAAEGAHPLPYPAIAIAPPDDMSALDAALARAAAGGFDWIVFTSANAVQQVAARTESLRLNTHLKVAAVGAATALALNAHLGLTPYVIPAHYDSAHLLDALCIDQGTRVLLPQSAIAAPDLAAGLEARGVEVIVVPVYRLITGSGGVDVSSLLAQRRIDAITFTSGSTVEHFLERYTDEGGVFAALQTVPLACMGKTAQAALTRAGLSAAVTAPANTLPALVNALKDYFDVE